MSAGNGESLATRGMSRKNPDTEKTFLAEEYFIQQQGARFTRVLTSFAFLTCGVPGPIDVSRLATNDWTSVEVVGVIGTVFGKEGLFGQAGWFSNYDLDWFWVRLTNILKLEVRCDTKFRRGDLCVWMSTELGDYAMLLPHNDYADEWDDILHSLGAAALTARFTQLPTKGPRPTWWPDRWKDFWPFAEQPRLKHPAPDETENDGGPYGPTISANMPRAKWRRLGPAGDQQRPTGYASNLAQLSAWHIERDTGMAPTRGVLSTSNNSARKDAADGRTTHKRGRRPPRTR
ncbi:hypothetical protein FRC08_011411 [Ceratobasidium sp. 394]|nr:hypothetical protein FRC08_011411 [Ceratobasidium sp. 394]